MIQNERVDGGVVARCGGRVARTSSRGTRFSPGVAVPPNGINGNPTSVVNRSLPDPVFLTVFVSSLSFVDAMMYQPPGRKIRMVDARLWKCVYKIASGSVPIEPWISCRIAKVATKTV